MFDRIEILNLAQGLAAHASNRQSLLAANVANADTPGFRARDLPSFAETFDNSHMSLRQTRAGHVGAGGPDTTLPDAIDAGGPSSPNGNTVTLEAEMVRGAQIRSQHDLALSIYQSSLGILRTSLGRGR